MSFFKSLDAESSNTTGSVLDIKVGGTYQIGAYGTWDGATVTFYVSHEATPGAANNGFTDANGTFTADDGAVVDLVAGSKIWAATTSVGTSSLTAVVSKDPVV